MDDDELIARVAAADDTALRELFSRHAPWLAARLRSMLSAADVEDVLQETFIAVWTGARRYRPQGSPRGWMWQIARRQSALFLRRHGPVMLPLPATVAASGPVTGDPADSALARDELARAIAVVGPAGSAERELWQLMYVEDRPVAEVAELTGVPAGTVKSRAHRVRLLLRTALADGHAERGRAAKGGPR